MNLFPTLGMGAASDMEAAGVNFRFGSRGRSKIHTSEQKSCDSKGTGENECEHLKSGRGGGLLMELSRERDGYYERKYSEVRLQRESK